MATPLYSGSNRRQTYEGALVRVEHKSKERVALSVANDVMEEYNFAYREKPPCFLKGRFKEIVLHNSTGYRHVDLNVASVAKGLNISKQAAKNHIKNGTLATEIYNKIYPENKDSMIDGDEGSQTDTIDTRRED